MKKLFESSVFVFSALVLIVAAIAVITTDDLNWNDWLTQAVYFVGIYAGKESVRYGSSAYQGANT